MLAILPATATVIGLLVLGQVPTLQDLLGIALVIAGVALHQDREGKRASARPGKGRDRSRVAE
jgi:inner membrane transporter RhtA